MLSKQTFLAALALFGALVIAILTSRQSTDVAIAIGPSPTSTAFYTNLPVISRPQPTPTLTPSPTATLPPSPTATQPPGSTGDIRLVQIHYNPPGSNEPGEFVEIRNFDSNAIQLQNWTLRDSANHVFTFPSFIMQPNQTCRVYTNQNQPAWCGFSYGSGSAIWNNSGDTATLRNSAGQTIDTCSYSGGGTTASCNP